MASFVEKDLHLDGPKKSLDNEKKQSLKYKLEFGLGATFCVLGWFRICPYIMMDIPCV